MKTFKNSSSIPSNRFSILFRLLACSFLLSLPTIGFSAAETGDPTASFSAANAGVEQAVPVNFVNQSANDVCYHWDFGDGTSSCEANPQHTYSDDGTYLVKLTAINETGATDFIGTVDVIEQ